MCDITQVSLFTVSLAVFLLWGFSSEASVSDGFFRNDSLRLSTACWYPDRHTHWLPSTKNLPRIQWRWVDCRRDGVNSKRDLLLEKFSHTKKWTILHSDPWSRAGNGEKNGLFVQRSVQNNLQWSHQNLWIFWSQCLGTFWIKSFDGMRIDGKILELKSDLDEVDALVGFSLAVFCVTKPLHNSLWSSFRSWQQKLCC